MRQVLHFGSCTVTKLTKQSSHLPNLLKQSSHLPNLLKQSSHLPNLLKQSSHLPNLLKQSSHLPNLLKQSSHLLVTLADAPENSRNLSLIEHKKYKRFLGEDSRPSYFPHKSPTCWGNGKD
jgi:hypothetical protein